MQKALLVKIALIGAVALLLQIPVEMIRGLIGERKQARNGVIADIARGTSEAQKIVGPILVIPWTRRSTATTKVEYGHVALLPETLAIEGGIESQEKYRGIYKAHLYTLNATLRGRFVLPTGFGLQDGAGTVVFGRAKLVLGLQDMRGLRDGLRVEWNGAVPALAPGGAENAGVPNGIHADLGYLPIPKTALAQDFSIRISLLGTQRLDIVPVGATTTVALSSTWPHPSFTGRILPDAGTKISGDGFAARWRTSHFATNIAQLHQRCAQARQCDAFQQHTLAVSFIEPVDLYQTVERSVKYGFLFILLTFSALFLFEVLQRHALHPIQYALVGFALAVFFLLVISLSEHLGFATAYALAASACVALIAYYTGHVLKSVRHGFGFGAALAGLYALLYVLLRSEDHALLMGSLLVFGCLAAAMIATRRVDWYALGVKAA